MADNEQTAQEVPAIETQVSNEVQKPALQEASLKNLLDSEQFNSVIEKVTKSKTKQEAENIVKEMLNYVAEKKNLLKAEAEKNIKLISIYNKLVKKENQERTQQFSEGLHREELLFDKFSFDSEKIEEKNRFIIQRTHYLFILFFAITFIITLLI